VLEGATYWMTKPLMPQIDGGCQGDECLYGQRMQRQRVKVAMAITSEEHRLCWKILDRKTKRVKFNTNIVVPSQATNRNEIFDERG